MGKHRLLSLWRDVTNNRFIYDVRNVQNIFIRNVIPGHSRLAGLRNMGRFKRNRKEQPLMIAKRVFKFFQRKWAQRLFVEAERNEWAVYTFTYPWLLEV